MEKLCSSIQNPNAFSSQTLAGSRESRIVSYSVTKISKETLTLSTRTQQN